MVITVSHPPTHRGSAWRRANPAAAIAMGMAWNARMRADQDGVPHDDSISRATLQAIMESQPSCACCGVELLIEQGHGRQPNSPSIDRVVPDRGYVIGNVAVICWRCNKIKSDLMPNELRQFVAYVERYE